LEPDLAQRSSHSPQSRSESNFWFRCYRIPKNNGRELRAKGNAEPVRVHDFKIPELGKVAPYGRPEDSGDPPAAWHQQMDRASPVRLHHSNWRRKPLVSHQVIVRLIGPTGTETDLKVCCDIQSNLYPKGPKVTEREMQAINTARHDFRAGWNYTISSNQQPP
jgi:hypothetical protein